MVKVAHFYHNTDARVHSQRQKMTAKFQSMENTLCDPVPQICHTNPAKSSTGDDNSHIWWSLKNLCVCDLVSFPAGQEKTARTSCKPE